MIFISKQVIIPEELTEFVKDPRAGALVTFSGVVRNNSSGRDVVRMEYEAHEEMAAEQIKDIVQDANEKFPVFKIAVRHRIGMLEVGEISVFIAVSAIHRNEAFKACEYIINSIKSKAPIWKKEYFQEGAVWVNGTQVK